MPSGENSRYNHRYNTPCVIGAGGPHLLTDDLLLGNVGQLANLCPKIEHGEVLVVAESDAHGRMTGKFDLSTRVNPVLAQPRDECCAKGVPVNRSAPVVLELDVGPFKITLERPEDGHCVEHSVRRLCVHRFGVGKQRRKAGVQRKFSGSFGLRGLSTQPEEWSVTQKPEITPPKGFCFGHSQPKPQAHHIEKPSWSAHG